jgi:hypothetical protein
MKEQEVLLFVGGVYNFQWKSVHPGIKTYVTPKVSNKGIEAITYNRTHVSWTDNPNLKYWIMVEQDLDLTDDLANVVIRAIERKLYGTTRPVQ